MRESGPNLEIGPTITESISCFVGSDVDRIVVDVIDLRQCFDQVDGVTFVASKLRPNGMSIDGDSDDRIYKTGIQSRKSCQILLILSISFLQRKPGSPRRGFEYRALAREYERLSLAVRVDSRAWPVVRALSL